MREHALEVVLRSVPVNATAARVTAQTKFAAAPDMTVVELCEIVARLQRKMRLLKIVLGVANKAQAKNIKNSMKGKRYASGKSRIRKEPRAALEFVRCGQEIQRMHREIQAKKAEKRGFVPVQHGWRGTPVVVAYGPDDALRAIGAIK